MPTLAQAFAAIDRVRTELAARHVRRIGVFGSVARGTARSDSDVDFLVDLNEDADLLDLVAIRDLLSAELGCDVDVASAGGLKQDLREAVLREVRYAA